jgi:hypothetical protein
LLSKQQLLCPSHGTSWRSRLQAFPRWPSLEAKQWVNAFAERVCPDMNTRALLAIGSVVRPVERVNDVDLVFLYGTIRPPYEPHPLDVDLRIYDAREVPRLISEGHDVLSWALRFGTAICEHDDFWSTISSQWRSRAPLPNPRVADERAVKTKRILQEVSRSGDVDAAEELRLSLLTHEAWAFLLHKGVHPASRAELPAQLREVGNLALASQLAALIHKRGNPDSADAVT